MIQFLLGNLLEVIAGAGTLIGFVFAAMFGRERTRRKRTEDTLRRVQDGDKAAKKAQDDLDAGKSPDQIVRENDERWN